MYYSDISQSVISEEEAHLQIIQICERWFHIAHPNENFEDYFVKHPDLITIERWPSFKEITENNNDLSKSVIQGIEATAL
jgi:hypothetical protein